MHSEAWWLLGTDALARSCPLTPGTSGSHTAETFGAVSAADEDGQLSAAQEEAWPEQTFVTVDQELQDVFCGQLPDFDRDTFELENFDELWEGVDAALQTRDGSEEGNK